MTPKELLYGVIGAVVGAVGTYFVTEYMHDKEIREIYADFNDARDDMDELVEVYTGSAKGEVVDLLDRENVRAGRRSVKSMSYAAMVEHGDAEVLWRDGVRYILFDGEMREFPEDDEDSETSTDDAGETYLKLVAERTIDENVDGLLVPADVLEDEGVEEGEDEVTPSDAIFIIPNEQLQAGSQVILTYNRDDGSAEVARSMSVDTPGFDDVIDTDDLATLIGEEAYRTLRRSRARKNPEDTRCICVRNNVLNLDFAISY